jgi:hypothetical protein
VKNHSLSRRALATLLPVIASPAVAGPASSRDDATLLAACAEFHTAWADDQQLASLPDYPFGSPEARAVEEQSQATAQRMERALALAVLLPAATSAGLKAKADLVAARLPAALQDFCLSTEDDEIKLVLSLAADVLRGVA